VREERRKTIIHEGDGHSKSAGRRRQRWGSEQTNPQYKQFARRKMKEVAETLAELLRERTEERRGSM